MFFFGCIGDHRDLHELTHTFPSRRASDLIAIATALFLYQRNNASKNLLGGVLNVAVDIGGQRFMRWHTPRELPLLSFQDPTGKPVTLADFEGRRSEEHTSELQSLMRISYAVFCLKKKKATII